MAIKYIPYFPNTLEGQALLDNFVRTKRVLRYRDNDKVIERIERGMPLYEMELQEKVGENPEKNLIIRGECLSACAYLKDQDIMVDLVYIDPPFASGADYAKKVYIRRNPKISEAIKRVETEIDMEELKAFEEKMYGDVWDKERYLNWMYENLMAIKSVMSDTASIYVHLDWHIGHYVKILMDEIFGEDNFIDEIIWHYEKWTASSSALQKNHDNIYWYSANSQYIFNEQKEITENLEEKYKNGYLIGGGYGSNGLVVYDPEIPKVKELIKSGKYKIVYADMKGKPLSNVWKIPFINPMANERLDYATQKPEALLERIVESSSNKGMVVADFFGGSGVTAAVANKLNRKFIHCDVGINSIQTTRDRLNAAKAEFDILEIKDGVSLYRNPVQTMDKLKRLIPGLRNEDALDKFWEGSIVDTQNGMIPVYIPNLMDSTTRLLDIPLMNRIIHEAMPDLPNDTKRVIVYYIDITDINEIKQFIKEEGDPTIEIELRDLKQVLDNVVVEDYAEWNIEQEHSTLFTGWKVEITLFKSDRVNRKIDEVNQKGQQQVLQQQAKGKDKAFIPILISDEGLETIEFVSLDCTNADEKAAWHSDSEIKIDKLGYIIKNGNKTQELWNACIYCDDKPLRMKIRNICGDETIFGL